ncbi:MAG: hypothetical protein E3J36_03105 [Candidatus Nealsonbacteria bacterium]|nr:MAG: hypothetical protein E3J36_03105 [Candidatus Nealsonbacteria bacterium]
MAKKQKLIILIIIILVLVGGGLFYWWQNREIKGSPEDYVIKETGAGVFVENKKAGLTVKVPEGWEVKKIELLEGSIVFYTPDIEGKKQNEIITPPLEKGCGIETAVVYKKMDFEEMKKGIEAMHSGLGIKSDKFELITINNQQALKNTFDSIISGPSVNVCFTQKNKLYSFGIFWGPDEKEQCIGRFDEFLETVSIK